MAERRLRFIHASDFHLERPLQEVGEVPDHLRDAFLEAPYHAAEQVFETAIAEQADFLVLAGDIIESAAAGPHGADFLRQQFQRLADHDVAVYWAGGRAEQADRWQWWRLFPDTVHVLDHAQAEHFVHRRDGRAVAELIGRSRSGRARQKLGDLRPDSTDCFSIGIAHTDGWPSGLARQQVNYLALGGQHASSTVAESPCRALFPGTPQGRFPRESGPHGCTVVDVDADGQVVTRGVTTDVVRWATERIDLAGVDNHQQLAGRVHDRFRALAETARGIDLLVTCELVGPDALTGAAATGRQLADLLADLRERYGRRAPSVWPLDLTVEPGTGPAEAWYSEQTIRGEFLRLARRAEEDPDAAPDLAALLPAQLATDELVTIVSVADEAEGKPTIQQAARLGAALLTAQQPLSVGESGEQEVES